MKVWEVWSEGYRDNGGGAGAHKHGMAAAPTFDEAVKEVFSDDPEAGKYLHRDTKGWSYWGCRIYDNEADARRAQRQSGRGLGIPTRHTRRWHAGREVFRGDHMSKSLRSSTALANAPAVELERHSRNLADAYWLAIQHPFTAIPYVGDGESHRIEGKMPDLVILKRVPAPQVTWNFATPRQFVELNPWVVA